jgi:hypothetical protein
MAGHEELVETMTFDGKTTGGQAAVQILAAEPLLVRPKSEGRFSASRQRTSWLLGGAAPSQRRLRMLLPSSLPTSARGTARCWLTRRWAWSRPVGNDASLLPYDFFLH